MTRMSPFSSPLLLGFDEIEQLLERAVKAAGDGYPPYNIERLPPAPGSGERLRIALAVAGFSPSELEITLEDRQLVIRGRQKEQAHANFLHRGIAARHFQRSFVLADGMEVAEAFMENGLLTIELLRPEPRRHVQKIEIRGC